MFTISLAINTSRCEPSIGHFAAAGPEHEDSQLQSTLLWKELVLLEHASPSGEKSSKSKPKIKDFILKQLFFKFRKYNLNFFSISQCIEWPNMHCLCSLEAKYQRNQLSCDKWWCFFVHLSYGGSSKTSFMNLLFYSTSLLFSTFYVKRIFKQNSWGFTLVFSSCWRKHSQ